MTMSRLELSSRPSGPDWCWFVFIFLLACKDNEDHHDGGDDSSTTERVTYWQDVAPVIVERCAGCHSEGGIAPFRLDTYEHAAAMAQASVAAVEARVMPPWLVTSDGSCGDFADSLALDDDEIATFRAWVDDGIEEGTPRTDLVVPPPDRHWERMYFYDEPVRVDASHTLQVKCTYDTRDATEPVSPGWGTQNEMCLMGLFVVPVL